MKLVLLTVLGLLMAVVPTVVAKAPIVTKTQIDGCKDLGGGYWLCCDQMRVCVVMVD